MSTAVFSHIQFMHPKLEVKYLKLEQTKNRLFDDLEGLEDELLNRKPQEDKWSINQIIAHMILVEEITTSYMQRKLQKQEQLQSSAFSNIYKSILLKFALISGMKFKAPAVVATVPATASLPNLRQQWDNARFKLEDTLTDVQNEQMDAYLFKHPHAGPLSVNQTLTFLQDHFGHHLRQIQQLKHQLLRT